MSLRDNYSNFAYYTAYAADLMSSSAGANAGETIDMQGFGTVTFVINAASLASGGAMDAADAWQFKLQHGLASANGVSAWSDVPNSLLIHSTIGGYNSTAENGQFASLGSSTDISVGSNTFTVGYKGDNTHRYVRFVASNIDAASAMWLAGVAIMGNPSIWPVNSPVEDPA